MFKILQPKLVAGLLLLFFVQATYALDAPEPIVEDDFVYWSPVDAVSINVHRGNGEYVETLAGDATEWLSTGIGEYFFVSTDNGHWQNWARSQTVSVTETFDDLFGINPDLVLTDVHAIVYSSTAAELFWKSSDAIPNVSVEIYRIDSGDDLVDAHTNGRSYFDNTLKPGTTYYYSLVPYDEFGNFGEFVDVQLTTPDDYSTLITDSLPDELEPPELDLYYIPLPPENLSVEVYSSSALELFWTHASDYTTRAIQYHVYQDGQEIAMTLGSSLFIDKLEQGVNYEFGVEAVANALNSSEPATIRATTFGFPITMTTFGKPNEDRDTHRFYLWDRMDENEAGRWPSDCLFGARGLSYLREPSHINQPIVCFSPATRSLIHRTNFNFPLPGDNETNHVEAVEWLHARHIGLVADISTSFPETGYELSVFDQSGGFEGTYPILESVRLSDPDGRTRSINLDGKDVKVTVSIFGRSGGFRAKELIVIAEYWEPIPGQSTNLVSGWSNEGALVSWIEPLTGVELQTTYFAGRSAASITEDELVR